MSPAPPLLPSFPERFGQELQCRGRADESRAAMLNPLVRAADMGGENASATQHGFRYRHRDPFIERRRHQHVIASIDLIQVGDESGEMHPFAYATDPRALAQVAKLGPTAVDIEPPPRGISQRRSQGMNQQIHPLDRLETSHACEAPRLRHGPVDFRCGVKRIVHPASVDADRVWQWIQEMPPRDLEVSGRDKEYTVGCGQEVTGTLAVRLRQRRVLILQIGDDPVGRMRHPKGANQGFFKYRIIGAAAADDHEIRRKCPKGGWQPVGLHHRRAKPS
jgi:hypothetical protein